MCARTDTNSTCAKSVRRNERKEWILKIIIRIERSLSGENNSWQLSVSLFWWELFWGFSDILDLFRKLFMKKMNSILCPQNYLTTEDYNYILDHYKSGKSDYVSYKLGRQYKIMLDATDEEETEYKDYEVSIQGDQFISNIY